MCKTVNEYLNRIVHKTLGEEFAEFLENGNTRVRSQILTNENFICFNVTDKEFTLEKNEKPLKVMIGIKLPDFNSCEAREFYGDNDTSNYGKVVKRVADELLKHKKFKIECEDHYIKIVNKVPSLSVTIFPYFIKQANQHFYISTGNGEWKPLIEELEVLTIPEDVNPNIIKVISLIDTYMKRNSFLINSSYISYMAFYHLLEKPDLDLKDSLTLVLKKMKPGLKKDRLIYNRIYSLQQTLERAVQIEKKDPKEAIELLDSFLK